MSARTVWRSNRLRRSPVCSSEMAMRSNCSSQPVITAAGGAPVQSPRENRGGRGVSQWTERCPDATERSAVSQAFEASSETDASGTNSFGLCRDTVSEPADRPYSDEFVSRMNQ